MLVPLFRVNLGLHSFFASSRSRVRGTFNDLYCPNFSPEVMLKLTIRMRGHFATLTSVGMHVTESNHPT